MKDAREGRTRPHELLDPDCAPNPADDDAVDTVWITDLAHRFASGRLTEEEVLAELRGRSREVTEPDA